MIQDVAPSGDGDEVRIVIRPNRSLTGGQLRGICLLFAAVTGAISLLSWLQGNAFAPLFAVLNVSLFVLCLSWVWRRCGEVEVIVVSPARFCVRRLPALQDVFTANPRWLRLDTSAERLVLYSAGRGFEVGAQLPPGERVALGVRLQGLLRQMRSLPQDPVDAQ